MHAYAIAQKQSFHLVLEKQCIWVPRLENSSGANQQIKPDYKRVDTMQVQDVLFFFHNGWLRVVGEVTEKETVKCPEEFAAIDEKWKDKEGIRISFRAVVLDNPPACEQITDAFDDLKTVKMVTSGKSSQKVSIRSIKSHAAGEIIRRLAVLGSVGDHGDIDQFRCQLDTDEEYNDFEKRALYTSPHSTAMQEISAWMRPRRNLAVARQALERAGFRCECSGVASINHVSFPSKDGNMYHEPHHLIPIGRYADFPEVDLDQPGNIVCLCGNCHNCIHYGDDALREALIRSLFRLRKREMKSMGVRTAKELLALYGLEVSSNK